MSVKFANNQRKTETHAKKQHKYINNNKSRGAEQLKINRNKNCKKASTRKATVNVKERPETAIKIKTRNIQTYQKLHENKITNTCAICIKSEAT